MQRAPHEPTIHRSLCEHPLSCVDQHRTPHSTPHRHRTPQAPCSTQVALGSCMRCIMYVVRHVRRVDALRWLGVDVSGATHDASQVHMDMDMDMDMEHGTWTWHVCAMHMPCNMPCAAMHVRL